MDGDLYDEFGNYLGSDSEQEEVFEVANAAEAAAPQPETVSGVLDDAGMLSGPSHAVRDIVLHEDKAYYEDARQTFGDGVGTFFCLVYLVIRASVSPWVPGLDGTAVDPCTVFGVGAHVESSLSASILTPNYGSCE